MAVTIKQTEAIPASYPDDGDPAIWQRLESYIAHRFTSRAVVWIVEGCGEWAAPLTPATISSVEIWSGTAWETCTEPDSPLGGYWLSGDGPYRFTGTVGGGTVPAAVSEAYTRLSNFLTETSDNPAGARVYSYSIGELSERTERDPAHIAKALQNSGAADLLRPYRRA